MLSRVLAAVRMFTGLEQALAGAAMTRVEAAHAMESRFLSCGAALEDLTRGSESLVKNSTELVRLATGKQEASEAVDGTMAVLAEPMAYLKRHAGLLRECGSSLSDARTILGKVLNCE